MDGLAFGSPALPLWGSVRAPGWVHLAVFGAVVPWLAVVSRARLQRLRVLPTLDQHLPRTFLTLLVFALLSVAVAKTQGPWLWPAAWPPAWGFFAGAAILAVQVAVARPIWRAAVRSGEPRLQLVMPRTPGQRAWWIAVALAAGIGEELTWRGVQVSLLAMLLGNAWLAAVVCSLMFAVAHAVQGAKSAVVIFGFALVFHALVALTGSLVVPVLVHVAYDVIAGLSYARLARELGYRPRPLGSPAEPAAPAGG